MFSHALCSRIPRVPQPNLVVLSRSTQGCSEIGGLLYVQPAGLGSIPNILPEQRSVFLQVALFYAQRSDAAASSVVGGIFATRTTYSLFRKHAIISLHY